MKNGVPFDVALSLPEEVATAWTIALGEQDGGEFDFATMRWKPRK
ncbi:hypothetical protein [Duganella vulcania]|nr:hypothetical protein [Duganella vulcania]